MHSHCTRSGNQWSRLRRTYSHRAVIEGDGRAERDRHIRRRGAEQTQPQRRLTARTAIKVAKQKPHQLGRHPQQASKTNAASSTGRVCLNT